MSRKKNIPKKLKSKPKPRKNITPTAQSKKRGKIKIWGAISIAALIAIALFYMLFGVSTKQKNGITHVPIVNNTYYTQVINKRKVFHDNFHNPQEFLSHYENNNHFVKFVNNTSNEIKISQPDVFYSRKKIINELNIIESYPDSLKLRKIHTFTQKNTTHRAPLYESREQHEPIYFFNVYGCGFCDDAAQNFALLANFFNFKSKIHWLSGHVVSSIYHDSAWRIYDPDALGIIRTKQNVASYDEMVTLARQNAFRKIYNKIYKTTDNNRVSAPLIRQNNSKPMMNFKQKEQRYFYKNLHMLSTDGHYLSGVKTSDEFFNRYNNIIANFIKEISIDELKSNNNSFIATDYFPLCGIFIAVPKEEKDINIQDIAIEFQTDFKPKNAPVPPPPERFMLNAKRINSNALKYQYFDLSLGIKNLENRPSHSFKLLNIDYLKSIKGAKLLLVHYYCVANSDFSEDNIKQLQKNGLQVNMK